MYVVSMRKNAAVLLVLLLTVSIVTFLPVKAQSKTIVVPDQYPTISSAIGNASYGDTVFVRKGNYSEQTLEIDKSISVVGQGANETSLIPHPPPSNQTIFDSLIPEPSTSIKINADNIKLTGFSISLRGMLTAIGNRIEISHNNITQGWLSLDGSYRKISENSIDWSLKVSGTNHVIEKNRILGGFDSQGSFNSIIGNIVNECNQFVYLKESSNLIKYNAFCILQMEYADSNTISNNLITILEIGFYEHNCSDNIVTSNYFIGPAIWGILIGAGMDNVFHDNLICNYTGSYDGME